MGSRWLFLSPFASQFRRNNLSLYLYGGPKYCLVQSNSIIIQGDGTIRLASYSEVRSTAKWFDNGDYYTQSVAEENVFPISTEGLQEAIQRHIVVRHQELLDNHYDNPGDFATERELAVYELIQQPQTAQTTAA
jgi:hypothetical protein